MFGGSGHIFDMINRMKENQRMLQSRRSQVRELRKIYLKHTEMPTTPRTSSHDLENIKDTIRKEIRRKKRKARFITYGIMLILLILLVWMMRVIPFQNFTNTFL